ncbi:hypothetical protein L249_4782 [Ophiocordyceps polyrhachis-furcata BCC 54312]|uniref:CN hydrolase domain-containing protein n=1 Tax=Ophiocordyceps polyrhachis-furcata BCC 54312 TaxID=1330021 RepID=A0A367L2Y3_9HYPO|nr:hypothetical protein L249_4782 [Ophiocordyceps polyrhachis-furcata BCC 54312]
MRIGCLQFAPQVGDIDNNLNRADAVLSRANADDLTLDLLVLPELAFTGYNFKSLNDISPFLEHSGSGITSLWARTTALRYGCMVAAGYPEKVDVSPKWPTGPEYYNSAIVVNADGETVANYRKSFLYYTDETWALEGNDGFYDGFIPGLGNTSIGICMDINPYKFQAPWHAFEFAMHILDAESNLVIVSMAWVTREDRSVFTRQPNEPHLDTLMYWVTRLEPLIRSENQQEIIVVFCNRTGIEDEVTYAGTSAVIGILDGEVNVYGLLGRGDKELLVVDTTEPPHAKLVYRPEPASAREAEIPNVSPRDGAEPRRSSTNSALSPRPSNDSTSAPRSTRQADTRSSAIPPSEKASPHVTHLGHSTENRSEKRRAANLQVPDRLEVDTESTNIPTPSAPSPTPMALRPRLTSPGSCSSHRSQPSRSEAAVAHGSRESRQRASSTLGKPSSGPHSAPPQGLCESDDPADFYRWPQTRMKAIESFSGGWEVDGRRRKSSFSDGGPVYVTERPSSADSSRNTILHYSRLPRRSSTTGDGGRQGEEFERFEEIVCPDCPVHGRRARSPPPPARSGRVSAPAAESRFRESMLVHAPSSPALEMRRGGGRREAAVEDVSGAGGGGFNPTTPRAMAFAPPERGEVI